MNKKKANGKIEVETGLELNAPELEVKSVTYNYVDNTVAIEVHFNEEGGYFKHSRNYTFENPTGKDLVKKDIEDFIASHDLLNKFS